MKIIDIANPSRVSREPDGKATLLSGGSFSEQGHTIKKVELRLFVEKLDQNLGPYSLITVLVETDKGQIESIYDEGYRGEDSLGRTANFITNNLGMSAIILRSVISLNEYLEKKDSV